MNIKASKARQFLVDLGVRTAVDWSDARVIKKFQNVENLFEDPKFNKDILKGTDSLALLTDIQDAIKNKEAIVVDADDKKPDDSEDDKTPASNNDQPNEKKDEDTVAKTNDKKKAAPKAAKKASNKPKAEAKGGIERDANGFRVGSVANKLALTLTKSFQTHAELVKAAELDSDRTFYDPLKLLVAKNVAVRGENKEGETAWKKA